MCMRICVTHTSRSRPLDLTDPLISDPLPKTCFSLSRYFLLFSGSSSAGESSHWSQLAEALQRTFTQGLMGSLSIKNSWHLTPWHGKQNVWRALIGWPKSAFFPQQSTKIDLSLSFENSGINRSAQIILTWVNTVCEREIFMAHRCAILYWWKLIIYENKYACILTRS